MDHAKAVGKEALLSLNHLTVHNTKQFEKLEMWAKMEEWAWGRSERKIEEEKARNKAEMDSMMRDMVSWKDQAEKMNAMRGEAAQEKRLFQVKALRLEHEVLALGDKVQTALKKGKTLSSAELKGIQMLLKKTARTAKSASLQDEPMKTSAPPPEVLPLPPPLPPLPPPLPGQAGARTDLPQLPPGAQAPEAGHEQRK